VSVKPFPKHLRRWVDFCCDGGSGFGCGHHIDAHGYGTNCESPNCDCGVWRDHTRCNHREQDADEAKVIADVARYEETLADLAGDCESYPADHEAAGVMIATARRIRLILAGERP
jgi:hypothetical protein